MRLTLHSPHIAASHLRSALVTPFVRALTPTVALGVALAAVPLASPPTGARAATRIVADAPLAGGASSDGAHALSDVVGGAVAGTSLGAAHRLSAGFRAAAAALAEGLPTPVRFGTVEVVPGDVAMVVRWQVLVAGRLSAVRVYRRDASDAAAPWVRVAELGPAVTEYVDAGVVPRRRYAWRVGAVDVDGEFVSREVVAEVPPWATRLEPNVPNPFNPSTRIRFVLGAPGRVRVDVFDAQGRHVRTLVDARRPAGRHEIAWNGRDDAGRSVASGIYFCRLRARGADATRKMLLLK